MKYITYSLYENNTTDKYYNCISKYAKKIVDELNIISGQYVDDFILYIHRYNKNDIRTKEEYLLEILMMGVFWKNYIEKAVCLKKVSKLLLIKFAALREVKVLKKFSDFNRGILGTLFLNKTNEDLVKINLENFNKLIEYLEAVGDYKEEIKRLKVWKEYFNKKTSNDVENTIQSSLHAANYLESVGSEKLSKYIPNVSEFLEKENIEYKWREDYIYCARYENEYFFNMIGAEIMNMSYRKDFLETKEKRLLLPACMRAKDKNKCKSRKTSEGYICSRCTKDCNINKYSKLGDKYNFTVYIIPHESSIDMQKKFKYKDIGIVGVSCVLNLVSGGLRAKNMNLVPQCVLLNYCGCKNHWSKEKIITDISKDRLFYILGIDDKLGKNNV